MSEVQPAGVVGHRDLHRRLPGDVVREQVARVRAEHGVEQRAGEGYMAECREEPGGGRLLVENHCPICAAARECRVWCRSELELFRAVLGRGAVVERVDHVPAGVRRGAYRVRAIG